MTWDPAGVEFFAAWYLVLWGCWPPAEPEARTEATDPFAGAFK